jgi:hypothetical protein
VFSALNPTQISLLKTNKAYVFLCIVCRTLTALDLDDIPPLIVTNEGYINLSKPTDYVMHQQFNLLKPTGYVMHQQFNIQQLYALPTLYLCVLYLPENKQRIVPLIS